MKKCNGCGITVDDRYQVGDVCPCCNKKWGSEYVVKPYFGKSRMLPGKFFWLILGCFFLLGTLYSLKKDFRYEKIAAGYVEQWMKLDTDSLSSSVEDVLKYNDVIRRKLFFMTTNDYLKILNQSEEKDKIKMIEFSPVIDSIYHSRWEIFNLSRTFHQYGLYLKILETANDDESSQQLRHAAETAVCKMKKKHLE